MGAAASPSFPLNPALVVIPLFSEGNYSFAIMAEKVKRNIAHKVYRYLTENCRTTSLFILELELEYR